MKVCCSRPRYTACSRATVTSQSYQSIVLVITLLILGGGIAHQVFKLLLFSSFRHTCKAAFRLLLRRPHGAAEISRQGHALGFRTRGDPDQRLPVGAAAAAGSHSGGGRRRLSGATLQTVPTTLEHRFKRSPSAPWNFVLMTLKTVMQVLFLKKNV